MAKTGSTSIQLRFFDNAAELKRVGILYPLGRFQEYPHQHSAIIALTNRKGLNNLYAMLRDIHAEAVSSHCHTVVLSGENISGLPEENLVLLANALRTAGFLPTAVVFFRPYLDYARSLASEHMKTRGRFATTSSLAAYLDRFTDSEIVARLISAFGAENVIRHDLASGDDSVALFDNDIGLVANLARAKANTLLDFATLNWLNAIKEELDVPIGLPQRLYAEAFKERPPLLAAEAAFLTEVADLVGGEKGKLLKGQLEQFVGKADSLRSIEAQIAYLKRFNRFITNLRRHMQRRALRRAFAKAFGRGAARSRRDETETRKRT
jgi:hypothetical protein